MKKIIHNTSNSFKIEERREFIKGIIGLSVLSTLSACSTLFTKSNSKNTSNRNNQNSLIKPPALKIGDTIGIVAPASGVNDEEITAAKRILEGLGFKVILGSYLTKSFGYLSAQDMQRADDFMTMIRNPTVKCVMAIRGGYGVMRILDLLDFDEIRRNPKIIIGYSDITALVSAVYQKSNMVAFHGPVAYSNFDDFTLDSFKRVLMNQKPAGEFFESEEFKSTTIFSESKASTIVGGKTSGKLVGGNLYLITSLMGTPYEIDTKDKILFIEEVGEEPYRVDRMLTQLRLSGKLKQCAGIALGRFIKCELTEVNEQYKMITSLEQVLKEELSKYNIPVVYGLSIGHIKSKLTIPIGVEAELNSFTKTLTIKEQAVSWV